MGTRSITAFIDHDGEEIFAFYRQFDGYPTGHGLKLAQLINREIVNGYGGNQTSDTHANGIGCLAASVIANLKDGIGGIYIVAPKTRDMWEEYVYLVNVPETGRPSLTVEGHGEEIFKEEEEDGICR